MENIKELQSKAFTLAYDMLTNRCPSEFSDMTKNSKALRDMLYELNGKSFELKYKDFRDPNHPVFQLTEKLIPVMIDEGLRGDEFFMNLVEYHNATLGEEVDFLVESRDVLIAADATYGTDGIRRQRLTGADRINIPTQLKVVKGYDEWKRFMAGRISLEELSKAIVNALMTSLRDDVMNVFAGITQEQLGVNFYPAKGTYDEKTLLKLIQRVEAANQGAKVTIVGTKLALSNIKMADMSNEAKDSLYNIGYYGKFYGTEMVYTPQRLKAGTDEFLLDDNKIYILVAGQKPIKVLNVGDGYLSYEGLPTQKADHTHTIYYGQEFGVGLILSGKMGLYELSA